jgi:DNA-binding CsgD family transcriptional regulator
VGEHGIQETTVAGREHLLALLENRFESAITGTGGLVFLPGEPGIGKTWILDSIANRLANRGANVLRGGAVDAEGMPPYLIFLEALGTYIRAAPRDLLRIQAGAGARILTSILPEVELKLVHLPKGLRLPPEQARLRLYEAVSEFLLAIAADAPLVLLMDDLQWADSATLQLLVHVARRSRGAPILFVGAYRAGEAAENSAFERAVIELSRQRLLVEAPLARLSEPDLRLLAGTQLDGTLPPEVVRRLSVQSEGNPFVAEELLRSWRETGTLVQHDGEWSLTDRDSAGFPSGILSSVRRRLSRLEPEVVDTLTGASIIGRSFEVTLLAAVMGEETVTVERRLLNAQQARLVREVLPGTFQFSHDTIRECLYMQVGSAERQLRHEAIGRRLESSSADNSARRQAELAFHFARSPDRVKGVSYSRQAADRALQDYAFEEAMRYYREALDLSQREDPEYGQLLLRRATAARLAEAHAEAVSGYKAAQTWFEQRGDRQAAAAAHGLGLTYWRGETLDRADASLEAALALAGDEAAPDTVHILVDLADLRGSSLNQESAGLELAERAVNMAHQLRDGRLEATANRTFGRLKVLSNDLASGIPLLEQALDTALAVDDFAEAAECYAGLANAYNWAGETRHSLDLTQPRVDIALKAHDPYQLRHVYSWAAHMSAKLGDWPTAEGMLARQAPIVERLGGQEPAAHLCVVNGFLAYQRGEYDVARDWLVRGLAAYRSFGGESLAWHLGLLGLTDLALGNWRAARACLDEQEELVVPLPLQSFQRGCALGMMVLTAVDLKDRERAARYYEQLVIFEGRQFWFVVDRSLGALALCLREYDRALRHLEAAQTMTERGEMRPELAHTLVLRARLTVESGGRGRSQAARESLRQALAIFNELGLTSHAYAVREELRCLPSEPGRRTSLPAGLSERELTILLLVAAGKSNPEIARELALSRKTVANHLTSILNKTGSENRAAAAVFAVRHGLA